MQNLTRRELAAAVGLGTLAASTKSEASPVVTIEPPRHTITITIPYDPWSQIKINLPGYEPDRFTEEEVINGWARTGALDGISDPTTRRNLAVVLENQRIHDECCKWNGFPNDPIAITLVLRVVPQLPRIVTTLDRPEHVEFMPLSYDNKWVSWRPNHIYQPSQEQVSASIDWLADFVLRKVDSCYRCGFFLGFHAYHFEQLFAIIGE